ncbi:hypothetical protein QR680_007285 [Steinernema hermaphroditum]|uniref:Uncharacterized protein n=1 Tax=Steinernema hermaphroditum TaxID=289476 RepID=A0AA39I021_9BILA|nr:hypothetical protein QR680_007285 [Steinernema hermaphroditum]
MIKVFLILVIAIVAVQAEEGLLQGTFDKTMSSLQGANTNLQGKVVSGTKETEGDLLLAGLKGYNEVLKPALNTLESAVKTQKRDTNIG